MLEGRLTELDLGVTPPPSGGGALLLHAEEGSDCIVVFYAWRPADDHYGYALATFFGCRQSIWGYPNEEAYWANQDASQGFFTTAGSQWEEKIQAFNRIRFPATGPPTGLNHYFMGMKDASGQFLAQELTVELVDGDYATVLAEALRRLRLSP